MFRAVIVVATICGFSSQAHAGGSSEAVRIVSLSILDGTDYVLVVAPQPASTDGNYSDPYFGRCERFEVRGTFSRLKGAWPWTNKNHLTRQAHIDALAYLSSAQRAGRTVEFGWMGTGFVAVDAKNPCVVRSRALQIIVDGGNAAVLSFHDVV